MNTTIAPVFNGIEKIVNEAPVILNQSKERVRKVQAARNSLIEQKDKFGMNDVLDQQMSTVVAKIKSTAKLMNEDRKPFTQMVDLIKKEFTGLESSLMPIINELQGIRDAYATEKMRKRQEEEIKAQLKLEEEKERIAVKQSAEVSYNNAFIDYLSEEKQKHLKWFSELLLDKIDTAESYIGMISLNFQEELKRPLYAAKFISEDEVKTIYKNELNSLQAKFSTEFSNEIQLLKKELIDKLPSKKKELEELSLADAQEAERILSEKKRREAEESERLKAEDSKKKADAEATASVQASGAQAAAMVDAQATLFDAPKVVESYEIKLSNKAGWLMLMQFWFEKEGKDWTEDKIEKMTFARAKVFCENWAKKNEEFISNPVISYEPKYKAK